MHIPKHLKLLVKKKKILKEKSLTLPLPQGREIQSSLIPCTDLYVGEWEVSSDLL